MPEDEGTLALDNVITDDNRMIFMMDEISRAACKPFDDRAQPLASIVRSGVCWRSSELLP